MLILTKTGKTFIKDILLGDENIAGDPAKSGIVLIKGNYIGATYPEEIDTEKYANSTNIQIPLNFDLASTVSSLENAFKLQYSIDVDVINENVCGVALVKNDKVIAVDMFTPTNISAYQKISDEMDIGYDFVKLIGGLVKTFQQLMQFVFNVDLPRITYKTIKTVDAGGGVITYTEEDVTPLNFLITDENNELYEPVAPATSPIAKGLFPILNKNASIEFDRITILDPSVTKNKDTVDNRLDVAIDENDQPFTPNLVRVGKPVTIALGADKILVSSKIKNMGSKPVTIYGMFYDVATSFSTMPEGITVIDLETLINATEITLLGEGKALNDRGLYYLPVAPNYAKFVPQANFVILFATEEFLGTFMNSSVIMLNQSAKLYPELNDPVLTTGIYYNSITERLSVVQVNETGFFAWHVINYYDPSTKQLVLNLPETVNGSPNGDPIILDSAGTATNGSTLLHAEKYKDGATIEIGQFESVILNLEIPLNS